MKRKIISLLLIFAFVLTSCKNNQDNVNQSEDNQKETSQNIATKDNTEIEYEKYSDTFFDVFDTIISFTAYTQSKEEYDKYYTVVKSEFERLHKLYTHFDEYEGINNVKTINDNAGVEPVKVDKDLFDLIKFSKEMTEKYSDKTDMAFGPVFDVWHNYREEGMKNPDSAKVPTEEELKNASTHTDIKKVILNEEDQTVFLEEKGMALDLGATSKGFASQIVMDKVKEAGCKYAILSAGGNIIALERPNIEGRDKWAIGVQDPDVEVEEEKQPIEIIRGNNLSIVTSGDYQRFYTVDGKRYAHIIDPETLQPAEKFKSVTIITKDSGLADYLSTTLFILDQEKGLELLNKFEDAEAMWVDKDGNIKQTEGFKEYTKN